MTEPTKDLGVAQALLARLNEQRLPKALALEAKVGRGEALDDFDIAFLKETFHNLENIKSMIDHHPEYQDLYARVTLLCKNITEGALENEKNPGFTV